ncbi:surfeit locus protein 6-domain-containing protein [Tuber brumale]|nr:surfeit locus protein 6-domain-containing protein [Tuber brumale]
MADIEERIRGYSNAFEGLLSLVPENIGDSSHLKRKQTKEESKKAKKAKLDSGSTVEGAPAKVEQGDEEKTEGGDETRKKTKMPRKKREKKPKVVVQSIGPRRGEEIEVREPSKTADAKATPAASEPQPSANQSHKPSNPTLLKVKYETMGNESESDVDVQMDSGDSTPHSQSTAITSPDTGELASTRAPKVELDAVSRAEKRALLVARIEELRARRQAADGTGARNRQELMEIRRKKEEARKERKKQQRLEAKAAEEAKRKEAQMATAGSADGEGGTPPSRQEQLKKDLGNNFSFGTVTFDDGQELDAALTDFKKARKSKGPTDTLGQLKHVEAKKARIQTMAPEKQAKIEEKELWSKALKQASGEKIRNDEQLLKKSLKRQGQVKKKSEREWKERIENVAKSKAMKQKRREDNLAARREQKKAGKLGKKVQMKKKKKGARPGFEGSMKSKPSGGGGRRPKKGGK